MILRSMSPDLRRIAEKQPPFARGCRITIRHPTEAIQNGLVSAYYQLKAPQGSWSLECVFHSCVFQPYRTFLAPSRKAKLLSWSAITGLKQAPVSVLAVSTELGVLDCTSQCAQPLHSHPST